MLSRLRRRGRRKVRIKPNCRRCYYGGAFRPDEHLATCECDTVTEPTVIMHDPLFNRERKYVSRENWADECDCECFVPHLSECEGDYKLEAVCTFNASFDCPFCGNTIDVWDIGIEETTVVTCDDCGRRIAVDGKVV